LLPLANLSRAARSKTIGGYEKSRYHLALKYFMCDHHLRMPRAIERHARASPRRNGGTRVYMRMRAYASASHEEASALMQPATLISSSGSLAELIANGY